MPVEIENNRSPELVCISENPEAVSNGASERANAARVGAKAPGEPAVRDRTKRIQEIVEQVEHFPNPAARTLMHECLASLLALYGEGFGRVLNACHEEETAGQKVLARLLKDPLIRSLLLIHDLHPVDLATRLRKALDQVRPYMQSHGGNVEIIALEGDFARLRLVGVCKTCPSSQVTLELAVRKALEEHCPDLVGFEVES